MTPSTTNSTASPISPYRVLALDGGGAKGFYTIGILDELEKNLGKQIHEVFDLIFGTSTGAIIAALLARGDTVGTVLDLYRKYVPTIMAETNSVARTTALRKLGETVFADTTAESFKSAIGIVSTNWKDERPLIFKASARQAHGSVGSFVPFFGCSVADAVIASCSAYPFFERHTVTKSNGDIVELADGGFCANNPTLYAIADAINALHHHPSNLRVVSIGVGQYPEPSFWKKIGRLRGGWGMLRHGFNADFLQKILGTNTCSMDVLRTILFKDVPTIRISDTFAEPHMATDLLEHDTAKLNRLIQKGRLSYAAHERQLAAFLKG